MNFVGYVACYVATVINLVVLVYCYSKTNSEVGISKFKKIFFYNVDIGISVCC